MNYYISELWNTNVPTLSSDLLYALGTAEDFKASHADYPGKGTILYFKKHLLSKLAQDIGELENDMEGEV